MIEAPGLELIRKGNVGTITSFVSVIAYLLWLKTLGTKVVSCIAILRRYFIKSM